METFDCAVDEFRRILATAPTQLSEISETSAATPRAPEQWSSKQIIGHLLDSAANNHHRFVRAQIEGVLIMPGYAQNEWVAVQHYQDRSWNELITLWAAYNRHLLHLMEVAPAAARVNSCGIGKDAPVTLEFLMTGYVSHLKHHLEKVLIR